MQVIQLSGISALKKTKQKQFSINPQAGPAGPRPWSMMCSSIWETKIRPKVIVPVKTGIKMFFSPRIFCSEILLGFTRMWPWL